MQASNQPVPLRAPNGLKRRGKSTFKHLTGIYSFDPGELILLTQLCRSVDRLDAIETLLARDGMLVTGEHGQVPRAHPLLSIGGNGAHGQPATGGTEVAGAPRAAAEPTAAASACDLGVQLMAHLRDDGRDDCTCGGCRITGIRNSRWERQREFRPDLPPPPPWGHTPRR